MIFSTLDKNIEVTTVIIGSGIAAGTLAQKFYDQKKDFIIIEAGEFKGDSPSVSYKNIGLDFGVRSTTRIQIGGTSNLWHGVLSPLDEIDFKKREWIPNSGWPVSLNDLKPFYKESASILGVKKFDYFEKEKLSSTLKSQLNKLKFNSNFLENKLFQQPVPPLNFKDIIKRICKSSSFQHLYYNTVALKLVINDSKIDSLLVGSSDGKIFSVDAKQFIVCCGALESPRLLLNSNIQNNNLGKYLMDHPMGNLCQLKFLNPGKFPIYSDTKYSKSIKIKSGFELKENMQKQLKLPNHNFFLRPSFIEGINNESEKVKLSLLAFKDGKMRFSDLYKLITNYNVVMQILSYKLSLNVTFKYADLFFVTEQIPNETSFVGLSSEKDIWNFPKAEVNWRLCNQDIDAMKRWYHLVLTKFFPLNEYCFSQGIDDFNWENILLKLSDTIVS